MEEYKNLGDMLDDAACRKPNTVAYTFIADNKQIEEITYGQLATRAKAIAGLIQKNAKQHDRVLLIYPPGIELIAAYFACMYAGAIAVLSYPPVTPDLAEKLIHIINNAEPALCLTTQEYLGKVSQLRFAKKILKIPLLNTVIKTTIGKKFEYLTELPTGGKDEFPWLATDNETDKLHWPQWTPVTVTSNDIAFLQYTSGSTGAPKGVIVSHQNLLSNLAALKQIYAMSEQDCCVSWLPPNHDMGLIGGILEPLYAKFPCRLMSPVAFLKNPLCWLETISRYQATCSVAPNFAFDLCVKRIAEQDRQNLDLSHLRLVVSGAEPVRPATIEKFSTAFAVSKFDADCFKPCYGLAEGTLIIAGTLITEKYSTNFIDKEALLKNQLTFLDATSSAAQALVSCGHILPNHQIRIVNPETKALCADHEVGEIWIAGPCIAQGYWQQPTLTSHTFQAYLTSGEGPFMRSGDLGFIKDNQLTICGRHKDIIIVRGKKYYPQDIERCVDDALPAVIRSNCSVAFSVSGDEMEKLIFLAEVKDTALQSNQEAITKNIIEAISREFGLQLHSVGLLSQKTLKKTTSGKVRRAYTKDLFMQNKLNYLHHWQVGS